jgi:hypothetical protein
LMRFSGFVFKVTVRDVPTWSSMSATAG